MLAETVDSGKRVHSVRTGNWKPHDATVLFGIAIRGSGTSGRSHRPNGPVTLRLPVSPVPFSTRNAITYLLGARLRRTRERLERLLVLERRAGGHDGGCVENERGDRDNGLESRSQVLVLETFWFRRPCAPPGPAQRPSLPRPTFVMVHYLCMLVLYHSH